MISASAFGASRSRRGGHVNHVGMELPQRDERHFAGAKRRREFFAICSTRSRSSHSVKPRFSAGFPSSTLFAAGPRAESMHQPAELFKRARLHDLQAARAANYHAVRSRAVLRGSRACAGRAS